MEETDLQTGTEKCGQESLMTHVSRCKMPLALLITRRHSLSLAFSCTNYSLKSAVLSYSCDRHYAASAVLGKEEKNELGILDEVLIEEKTHHLLCCS